MKQVDYAAAYALLVEAVDAWPQLARDQATSTDSDLYINGADMIEWFTAWRIRAMQALDISR